MGPSTASRKWCASSSRWAARPPDPDETGSPSMTPSVQPRLLMCRPKHFAVTYAINPWMDPGAWAADGRALGARARQEWERLHHALFGLRAAIELVPPVPGLPALVFTANAAVVMDR